MPKKKTPRILKVYWSKREAKIGEKVKLEAVTQDAAGKIAQFTTDTSSLRLLLQRKGTK